MPEKETKKSKSVASVQTGDAKHQAADAAVEHIKEMFGEGSIMKFGINSKIIEFPLLLSSKSHL
jgi:hypothetical protein